MSARGVDRRRAAQRLRRAVRNPLSGLLLAVAIAGTAWALFVPPWQSPDETWHFAYTQSLAERGALPKTAGGTAFSSAETLAAQADNSGLIPFYSYAVKPAWSRSAVDRYRAATGAHPSRSDGGGSNLESANPPLLYLFDALPYWASSSDDAFVQLYTMRLWNVILLLADVVGVWLLAGEVLGRARLAQTTGAAAVALIPMQAFMATSVNPDALLVPLWTFYLWAGARVIKRAAPTRDAVLLCALTAAGVLTKATSYALIPGLAFALGAGWLARPRAERAAAVRGLALASTAFLVPVLAWVGVAEALGRPVVNAINTRPGATAGAFRIKQLLSYVWEYYLPRLPFMSRLKVAPGLAVYDVWTRQGWGVFGYLDTYMPLWIYRVLGIGTAAVAIGAAALVTRLRGRMSWVLMGFFALTILSLLALLHVSEYRSLISGDGPLLQGRYILPISGLFGLAIALLVKRMPLRWREGFAALVMAAMFLVQVLALATIAKRYYT
jgi:4-amino-4-deoxy-L-arabinose transferase-like glycosyltransferase